MSQLKLSWIDFQELALEKLREKYSIKEEDDLKFIIERTEGEGTICETPNWVYINLN